MIGIDKPIQEMQQLFIDNLWTGIALNKKAYYHRVFRNKKQDLTIPEVFIEDSKDYKEVLFNDNLSVMSWFDVSDTTSSYHLGQIIQEVGILFVVNLADLYPTLSYRAVEESHLDVQKIILKKPLEFSIDGITTGLEAYGGYSIENLKSPDMQPWHVFRFNCNVKYSLNC